MKICLAQICSTKNEIAQNIEAHLTWVRLAAKMGGDLVIFPELSITGYEPTSADVLAMDLMDSRLNVFQQIADEENIAILIGAPIKIKEEIQIGMIIFQANQHRKSYAKQLLHIDEEPYFSSGDKQLLLKIQHTSIAPAICFEALQQEHLENAIQLNADIYLASVAKPQKGIDKAFTYFPKAANKHSLPILMVNAVGESDNFVSMGQSSVWNRDGVAVITLSPAEEELAIYDTETEAVYKTVLRN